MQPTVDLPAELVVAWARASHQAGLTTDVLEDGIRRFAAVLRVAVQVNALPTSLTLALGPSHLQRVVILRLPPGKLHLRRLAQLAALQRLLRDGGIDAARALDEVRTIDAVVPPDPPALTIAAYALNSLGASLLLGGGRSEIAVSATIGVLIGAIAAVGARVPRVDRLFEVLAAFTATLVIGGYERLVGPVALYVALVAGIVQLLPGFSLTTALNELANRQLVAGTARLGSVLVTLLSLASGFALGLAVTGPSLLLGETIGPGVPGFTGALGAAVAMGLAISALLHARPRDIGWIVLACAGTIAIARTLPLLGLAQIAPFGAALVVGIVSSIVGRLTRVPAAIVLVPALLVLVPGSLSYESLLYVFQADATDAVTLAVRAALAAILITTGFFFSQLLVPGPSDEAAAG